MKGRKKSIACLLSLVLIVTAIFSGNTVKVSADDVTDEKYNENNEFILNSESSTLEYGTVTVPEGYRFVIDNVTVTVTTINLKKDASLVILGENGKLACTEWTIEEGARMELDKNTNIPSDIDVYDELPDGQGGSTEQKINGDSEWEVLCFLYNNENKWVADHSNDQRQPGENQFILDYDDRAGEIEVKINTESEITYPRSIKDFAVGTKITFTINASDEYLQNMTVDVIIYEGENPESYPVEHQTISNGVFEYTPSKTTPFEVRLNLQQSNNNEPGLNWDRLQQELDNELFAFGAVDSDNDSDTDDLKYGIAKILYQEFGQGSRYQREGEALGIGDFNSVLNNMTVAGSSFGKISVYKKGSDTSINLNGYNVTFTGTETNTSNTHTFTAKVYLIDETNFSGTSDEQVIIKVKDKYFIRDAYSRDQSASDLEQIEGANARALIIVSEFTKKSDIKLFGNFATGTEEFSDESTKDMFSSGFSIMLHDRDAGVKDLGDKFIVMKPTFTGFTLTGESTTQSPLAWSSTGSFNVTESNSGNANVDLYFGYDTAEINPITEVTGLDVKGIESVNVSGDIPSNAVEVSEKDENGNYKITFKSNYYDTVPIEIVYEKNNGGTITKKTTINRVGIVIEGGRTAGGQNYSIHHGHDGGGAINSDGTITNDWNGNKYGSAVAATYYYPESSNPSEANVSLYVTITYTNGTVEQKIVETTKFTKAENGNTAMSDYVLFVGSSDNQIYPVKVEAIAVPNVNAEGRFVGAKLGAGKGVTQEFVWD